MIEHKTAYSPITYQGSYMNSWTGDLSILVIMAKLWNKYMPRGKGAVPRFIGQVLGKNIRNFIKTSRDAYLAIEPTSLDVYVHMLNHGRVWNEHVFNTCSSLLSKGNVFYDIGANVGYMSIEMAKLFDDQVTVISFEPQMALSRVISLSAQLNNFNKVEVFDVMLGDREGESELFLTSHSIHASSVARETKAVRVKRTMTTIDKMVENGVIPPPNVMKVDIEGGELSAFSGAKNTIANYHPIIIFEADENMERFGYSRSDLLDLIGNLCTYNFSFINKTSCDLIHITRSNIKDNSYSDILANPA